MTAMTAVAPPVAVGKGGRRSTPTYYRAYSLVAGAALVLAAVAASALIGALSDRTDRVRDRTGPVLVATQQLYSSLAEADAAATAVQLSGADENREQRRFYEQALERSTQQIERVATLIGDDPAAHETLQSIAADLTRYAGVVETARAQNKAGIAGANATLTSALDLMRSGIGTDVGQLTTISERHLADDYTRPVARIVVAVLFLVAALVALVALQRFMTKRARRLVNAPIAIATLAVVVLAVWMIFAEMGQRSDLRSASRDGYASISSTARIQGVAYRAKADESLALLGTGAVGSFESFEQSGRTLASRDITAADAQQIRDGKTIAGDGLLFDAARLADSSRERYAAAEMLVRWQRYRDTNRTIQAAATRGDRQAARLIATTTGNQAFNGFNLSVESVVQDNTTQFEDSLSSADHRLRYLGVSALLVPVAALLLMLWGTQMRINEYR
jgi:CHASE3 domain sensor protein